MKKMFSGQSVAFVFKSMAGRYWLIIIWLITLSLSSCSKKECAKPANFCGTPGKGNACNTFVTVRNAMCGVGIWGNSWLQLDNGEYLQPWESPLNLPANVTPGQRFKINYEVIQPDKKYANVITCMAVPVPAKPIRINCFEAAPPVTCGTIATVRLDDCFPAYWGNFSLELADGSLLRPWGGLPLNQPLLDGQTVKIGYEITSEDATYQGTCNTFLAVPFTAIKVTCLETGEVSSSETKTGLN